MLLQYTALALISYPIVVAFCLALSPLAQTASLLTRSRAPRVPLPLRQEEMISKFVIAANLVNGVLTIALFTLFALSGFKAVELSYGTILSIGDYNFHVLLLIDKYSVAFQVLIGILTGLVLMFSRRYMHREHGYIRFFASLFFFVSGISIVSMAATIDMLFAGWEIVGISSFLLIGFYRIRMQPGRNALKTYAVYRFCDIGLFLGAYLFHKLGNEYFFLQYADHLGATVVNEHTTFFVIIGLLTVLAAMGKSAQYPFSFWVPRAMEGPTPSSAIFYGALSIHAGVYLLIRLYPLWTAIAFIPWLVGVIGFITAVSATISLKTQSNVKAQIGYASVAQVGLMFIEVALGWREVAMIHFIGNAALRCYQLLASPSVMVLYLRQQAEGAVLSAGFSGFFVRHLGERMRHWFFALSFSEGYAEALLNFMWRLMKKLGRLCAKAFSPFVFINITLMLLLLATFGKDYLGSNVNIVCAVVLGVSAIFIAVAAVGVSRHPSKVLWMTTMSAGFKGLSAIYLSPENAQHSLIYFVGITAGFVIAWIGLRFIPESLRKTDYAGAAESHSAGSTFYLVGILWISGFTLSPTFFGEDLLLHFGAEKFAYETFFIGSAFILNGVTLMRSYVKLAFAK